MFLRVEQVIIFQFHYGTIKRINILLYKKGSRDFNSIMVRLKAQKDKGKNLQSVISIPLWYD